MPSLGPCAHRGCERPAAFKTRTNPAWCDEHITEILKIGGLEPLERFTGPAKWRLTRCLTCGCAAHYRLVYTVDKNRVGEPTCRACYWRQWAARTRQLQGAYAHTDPVPKDDARRFAEDHGYDYLGPLTNPSLPDDPHYVRCRHCGRLSAQRLGDIGWGCQCQVNPRRTQDATEGSASVKKRGLFKDAGIEAVDWWDHDRNSTEAWETVTPRGTRTAWWMCPECGERFEARVVAMAGLPLCPVCEPRRQAEWRAAYEQFKNTPIAAVPELLAAWADDADPSRVMVAGDHELRRFGCPEGHHPRLSPMTYLQSGCPHCRGQRTTVERLALRDINREAFGMNAEIAAQWHPTKNGNIDLGRLSPNSRKRAWWLDPSCGHEWQASPAEREKRQRLRCPVCRTILDSLAYHFPRLADQWSPTNPLSPLRVRPTATLDFVPTWVCTDDQSHTWKASLASRTAGSECPMCRQSGKSSVELLHLEAARAMFGNAASGRPVRHQAFTARAVWHPDIAIDLADGRTLVIEYDGSYWHADKLGVDTAKTRDLLAAGVLVVRVREYPLLPLPMDDPHYLEITVHAAASNPQLIIGLIADWERERPR